MTSPNAVAGTPRANGARPDRGAMVDTAQTTDGTTTLPGYVYLVGAVAALGGLLFGYDAGVISGALGFLSKTFHLTPMTQEVAVSVVLIGAIAGAACGGKLADALGRKKTLIA